MSGRNFFESSLYIALFIALTCLIFWNQIFPVLACRLEQLIAALLIPLGAIKRWLDKKVKEIEEKIKESENDTRRD
jgi:hypothetical protein